MCLVQIMLIFSSHHFHVCKGESRAPDSSAGSRSNEEPHAEVACDHLFAS